MPLVLALVGLVVVLALPVANLDQGSRGGDFYIYYDRVTEFRADPDLLYAWTRPDASDTQRKEPFLYPPTATLLIAPFTLLSRSSAWTCWKLLQWLALGYVLLTVICFCRGPERWQRAPFLVTLACVTLTFAWIEIDLGQVNFIVAALVAGSLHAHVRRHRTAAVVLALCAGGLKLFPLFLVPLFIWWAPGKRLVLVAAALAWGMLLFAGTAALSAPTAGWKSPEVAIKLHQEYLVTAVAGTASRANYDTLGPQDAFNWSVAASAVRVANKVLERSRGQRLDQNERVLLRRCVLVGALLLLGVLGLACGSLQHDRMKQCALATLMFPLLFFGTATTFPHHLTCLVLSLIAVSHCARRRGYEWLPGAFSLILVYGAALPLYAWWLNLDVGFLATMCDRGLTTLLIVSSLLCLFWIARRSPPKILFANARVSGAPRELSR